MCPSVVIYAVYHIVAPSPSNNTRKICIWICAWNNYVSYTLVCVHFIVCSMYVSSCSTPSISSPSFYSPANSSPANSAIPLQKISVREVNKSAKQCIVEATLTWDWSWTKSVDSLFQQHQQRPWWWRHADASNIWGRRTSDTRPRYRTIALHCLDSRHRSDEQAASAADDAVSTVRAETTSYERHSLVF